MKWWIREKLGRRQEDRPFSRLLLPSWQDDGWGRMRRSRYRQEIVRKEVVLKDAH